MDEPWRELKPGDKVRIVRVPTDFALPNYQVDPDTVAVYQALADANAVLTIDYIDEYGHPWTKAFDFDEDGKVFYNDGMGHTLALDDDSWERIS